jgi:hypothetical protein
MQILLSEQIVGEKKTYCAHTPPPPPAVKGFDQLVVEGFLASFSPHHLKH